MLRRDLLRGGLCLAAGGATWSAVAARVLALPTADSGPPPDWVDRLAEARVRPWEAGTVADDVADVRRANPEYDLMSRTFLALALGDLALRDPTRWRKRALGVLDSMIELTGQQVAERGPGWFLLPYWDYREPKGNGRSVFVDGERLLVMAIRRFLAESASLAATSRDLADTVAAELEAGPLLSAESYPDECWTFCNTLALAALRLVDAVDGERYAALRRDWVTTARARLVDPDTGLLISSFRYDGARGEGPEGSSIWLATHMLRLVDADFAADQYALARAALGREALGFGWAREWPPGAEGAEDVDSGPVVPLLEASPSSSGLAILAARSFGDATFARELLASLDVAGFPLTRDGAERFQSSNAVGDAVILAGVTAGPLWDAVLGGGA